MKKGESPVRASSPKKARQWAEEIIELPLPHLTEYLTGSFKVDKKGSTLDGEGMATDTLSFDVTIYQDALALLLGEKTDVRAEIMSQLQQGDPALEDIADDLYNLCEDKGLDADRLTEHFNEEPLEKLMGYISFSEEEIEFDYGESEACGDRRCVAFRVKCVFDAGKYIKEGETA